MDKVLFSNTKVDPSISPFIKNRIEILIIEDDYSILIQKVKAANIQMEGFKVEYVILNGDFREREERREKLKDIGYNITGEPNFVKPTITYSLSNHLNKWYFGVLTQHNMEWQKHKKKPCSFSNSIGMDIAKSLLSTASKGDKNNKILDACCGVGTIMLEACIAGFKIEGCDINPKRCEQTKNNLNHFNYSAKIHCLDVKDLSNYYNAAIIDLPYNLYSFSNNEIISGIITSTSKLTPRLVIVSTSDVAQFIKDTGFSITDSCTVEKRGKSKFQRTIWVCEKVT